MMPSINMLVCEKDGQSLFPSAGCGFALSGLLKPRGSLLPVIPTLTLRYHQCLCRCTMNQTGEQDKNKKPFCISVEVLPSRPQPLG